MKLKVLTSLLSCIFVFGQQNPVFANNYSSTLPNKILELVQEKAFVLPDNSQILTFREKENPTKYDIQAFLNSFDQYATWTDSHERQSNLQISQFLVGGIGMDIVKNKDNTLVCIPYPNSPAFKAGIKEHDVLLAVDGLTVTNASLDDISVLVRGDENTKVSIKIQRGEEILDFNILRAGINPIDVEFIQEDGFARIRIWQFMPKTSENFRKALEKVGNQILVIDLRSNTGGNLLTATACIAEFLSAGNIISQNETRDGFKNTLKNTKSAKDGKYNGLHPIILWQDDLTASSAEVFIAALMDNHRAVSFGFTTFGKSHAQSLFPVDKHVLALTTELLMSPDGLNWSQVGIKPQLPLQENTLKNYLWETKSYLAALGYDINVPTKEEPSVEIPPLEVTPIEPSPLEITKEEDNKSHAQKAIESLQQDTQKELSQQDIPSSLDTEKRKEELIQTIKNLPEAKTESEKSSVGNTLLQD